MLLILILYFKSPWAGHVEVALHICLSADQHKIDLFGPDKFWLFFKSQHSENKHLLHRMWWFGDQIPWWQPWTGSPQVDRCWPDSSWPWHYLCLQSTQMQPWPRVSNAYTDFCRWIKDNPLKWSTKTVAVRYLFLESHSFIWAMSPGVMDSSWLTMTHCLGSVAVGNLPPWGPSLGLVLHGLLVAFHTISLCKLKLDILPASWGVSLVLPWPVFWLPACDSTLDDRCVSIVLNCGWGFRAFSSIEIKWHRCDWKLTPIHALLETGALISWTCSESSSLLSGMKWVVYPMIGLSLSISTCLHLVQKVWKAL